MYTTIPHDMLLNAIQQCTREAFDYAAEDYDIDIGRLRLEWIKEDGHEQTQWIRGSGDGGRSKKDHHTFSHSQLNEWVRFLVENIYIVNDGTIRRQVVGIPMGTNCAPPLANLFLYAFESAYIDRLEEKDPVSAGQFHMTFRLIDDTLAIDNPQWEAAVADIYPRELKLADTTPHDEAAAVHFLGMDIFGVDDRFRLRVYDKRDDFPFTVVRYPRMESLIPQTIPYGVFSGQLHRGYRICSMMDDFLSFAVDVGRRLMSNGCRGRRLSMLFSNFVQRFVTKWSRHDLCNRFRRALGNSV